MAVILLIAIPRNERSFNKDIVNIDTTDVTKILIYPHSNGHKEICLFKSGNIWKVKLNNNIAENVPAEKITNIFNQLLSIKPLSLVTRDAKKYKDLMVDTSGTKVKIFEDYDLILDLIIGRFSFKQPSSIFTNVRLNDKKEVFITEGFLETTFGNVSINNFRNTTLIKADFSTFNKLSFVYPADTSFQIIKVTDIWQIDDAGINTDNMESYLAQTANLSGTDIVNKNLIDFNKLTKLTLTIETDNNKTYTLYGFINKDKSIINSSLNPNVFFNAKDLIKQVFVGKKYFVKQ
ncbi:MAG: DUF4340 domain-containing protein [bacterium]